MPHISRYWMHQKALQRGFVNIVVIFSMLLIACSFTSSPVSASTANQTLALHVVGNHLENAQGQPIQLVGVNVSGGGNCIPIKNQPPGVLYPLTQTSDTQTVAGIANWHANVVRITLNEDCWLGINGVEPTYSGSNYRTTIVNFVDLLHSSGLYAIVDLHISAPGAYIANSQQVMADADHATAFWQSVADTFKNDPAVIFEAYNEPHITISNAQTSNPWACWRDGCTITQTDQNQNQPVAGAPSWQSLGMQGTVNAIRSTGATNPILLGGLGWSRDLTQLFQYLPTDPQNQLIIAYHNYMSSSSKNTPAYWNNVIAPIAQKMPVITSEMGEKDGGSMYNGQFMAWADAHGVSYIAWAWGTAAAFGKLGLLANWDGTPGAYGQVFYDHFHAVNPITP